MDKILKSKLLIVFFVFLIPTLFTQGQDTLRILFIGNSLTYVENLPGKLKALAQSDGKVVITGQSAPGGYTLSNHSTYGPTLDLLNQHWDYVVMHEQSMGLIQPTAPGAFQSPIEILDSLVRRNCGKTLLYVTAGYPNTVSSPLDSNYFAMQDRLIKRYRTASQSVRAALLPTGHSWRKIISDYPQINTGMWASTSDYHPGVKGQYLNACVLFSVLYGKSPVGLAFPSTIPVAEAAILQGVAWEQTKDSSFVHGYYKLDSLQSGFGIFNTEMDVTLTDSSSSMSNQLVWNWGDGDSTVFVPTVSQNWGVASHTYTQAGPYTIKQKVSWSNCGTSETTKEISVGNVNVSQKLNSEFWTIFPNPGTSSIQFKGLPGGELTLIDYLGRQVGHWIIRGDESIEIDSIPNGMYQWKYQLNGKSSSLVWVKN